LIDSQNGEPDALGAHSALVILNTNNIAATLSQRITVCPKSVYKVYIAIKILALGGQNTGGLKDNSQCNVFIGIENGGNSTIPGSSLSPGAYTTFTTANTFTTDDHTESKISISINCATGAFTASNQQGGAPNNGYFYLDNIQLVPQEQH
jgi:hypothetical protein